MNTQKSNSPLRLIAFFLVSLLLVCTFGFTVDGWSVPDLGKENLPSQDNNSDEGSENNDGNKDSLNDTTVGAPEIYIPEYTSPLTGLESDEVRSNLKPLAFLYDNLYESYGISSSEILIEYPIEKQETIYISLTTLWDELSKIGSLASMREGVASISEFFSSVVISKDNSNKENNVIGLSEYPEGYYTEYKDKLFTKNDFLSLTLSNSGISLYLPEENKTPLNFKDFLSEETTSGTKAEEVSISFSDKNKTSLYYSSQGDYYTVYKNDSKISDPSNASSIEFTNCLILFADSVTYENEDGERLILDTASGGFGYYASKGVIQSIKWSTDQSKRLILTESNGDELIINRGKSFISFMKSSEITNVSYK